jgi:preprotein translocase subunit SecG
MADVIWVAYSLAILVVAAGGVGFVMLHTSAGEDAGGDWKELLGAALVIGFLTAMIVTLIT